MHRWKCMHHKYAPRGKCMLHQYAMRHCQHGRGHLCPSLAFCTWDILPHSTFWLPAKDICAGGKRMQHQYAPRGRTRLPVDCAPQGTHTCHASMKAHGITNMCHEGAAGLRAQLLLTSPCTKDPIRAPCTHCACKPGAEQDKRTLHPLHMHAWCREK